MTAGVLSALSAPDHWNWRDLWAVAPRVKEFNRPDLPALSVYLEAGVVPRSSRNDNRNQLGEDLSRYLVVRPNDIVFNKLRTWQGGLGVSEHAGIVSPAYFVCRPSGATHPRFLHYLLRSTPYLTELTRISKWMPPSQFDTPWDQLRKLPLLLPPLEEQCRIANFLDAETARIDRVRESREVQGTLLSSMLGQLVNGATAGDAETLKKLGVAYDSADWGLGKVSRLCRVVPGYAFPSEGFVHSGGTRLLRGINVSVDETSWDETVSWDEDNTPTPQRFHLRAGDLVLGMDRPWISSGMRMTFISEKDLPALLLQRVACLRPNSAGVDMRYIYWSLRSLRFRQAVEGELTGVSVPHLSGDQIGAFVFPLPPISTQREISDRLSAYSARIRKLRSTMNRQAELLNERRQALITAAVTGQFDVSTASGRNVTDNAPEPEGVTS